MADHTPEAAGVKAARCRRTGPSAVASLARLVAAADNHDKTDHAHRYTNRPDPRIAKGELMRRTREHTRLHDASAHAEQKKAPEIAPPCSFPAHTATMIHEAINATMPLAM